MSEERPIVLSADEVRGILDGSLKELSRRADSFPREDERSPGVWWRSCGRSSATESNERFEEVRRKGTRELVSIREYLIPFDEWMMEACPFGKPGTVLWAKETFAIGADEHDRPATFYKATDVVGTSHFMQDGRMTAARGPWRPCTHMQRWASRITILNEGVRIEERSKHNWFYAMTPKRIEGQS